MSRNGTTISNLQAIVTALSQQADAHAIQSRIFANQGFTKLGDKYAEHAAEERGFVSKFVDRIIDLGGEVKLEAKKAGEILTDPVEWIRHDLEISREGLASLVEVTEATRTDYTTYDLLKEYYQDEEGDLYWSESQLELIDKIGAQNWLLLQI